MGLCRGNTLEGAGKPQGNRERIMFDRFKKLMTFTSIIFCLLLLFLISRLLSANQEKKNEIAYLEVQLNITRKVIGQHLL